MKPLIRDQVLDLLRIGCYTKLGISNLLKISVASVASHMTILKHKGHFIIYDAEFKQLSLATKKRYEAWRLAKRKAPLTVEELIEKYTRKINRLVRALYKWEFKDTPTDNSTSPEEALQEVKAHMFLLELEIKRVTKKLSLLLED